AQRVDLDARLADHDAGPCGVDIDRDPLLVLADQDVRQPRMRELLEDVLPDLDVLDQRTGELLLADHPVRLPVVDDADAHAAGMTFLSFCLSPSFGATGTVMWHVRFLMRAMRPRPRARHRLGVGPSST